MHSALSCAMRTMPLREHVLREFLGSPVLQCHVLLNAQSLSTRVDPEGHTSAMQTRDSHELKHRAFKRLSQDSSHAASRGPPKKGRRLKSSLNPLRSASRPSEVIFKPAAVSLKAADTQLLGCRGQLPDRSNTQRSALRLPTGSLQANEVSNQTADSQLATHSGQQSDC